jgi:hypothetical protein
MRPLRLPALCFLLALVAPRGARAQWTLPQGDLVISTGLDFQYADSEFFGLDGEPRGERAFPLNGEYYGASLNTSIRVGLTDALEAELVVPFRVVSYASEPVVLLPQPADSPLSSLDYYQQNVIRLSRTTAGLADVQLAARYRWTSGLFLTTTELRLQVPGGYDAPAGTFGERPASAEMFANDVERFVRPENVTDDVTLGDGQVDLTLRQHFGVSFPTATFVAGDVGYNLRFGGAADQILASLRAGQLIEGVVLPFVGASMAISVEDGRPIGVSVAAEDPELPAEDYGGSTNLLLREVRLLRDYVDVHAGVIIRLSPEVELKVAYGRIVWGRNVAAVNRVSVGFAGRTQLFELPSPPAAASEPVEPEPVEPEPVEPEPVEPEPVDPEAMGPELEGQPVDGVPQPLRERPDAAAAAPAAPADP